MKATGLFLVFGLMATVALGRGDTPTLADLEAAKASLPMAPQAILDLKDSAEVKNKTIKLEAENYEVKLSVKDRAKLQKKGLIKLRIIAEVTITDNLENNPKKKVKKELSGSVELYVIDSGTGKLVNHKKEKLAKLCPS